MVLLAEPGDRAAGPLVHQRRPEVLQLALLTTVLVAEVRPVFAAHVFVAIKKETEKHHQLVG